VTKQLASINEKNRKLGEDAKFQLVLVGYDDSREGNESYLLDKGINFPAVKVESRQSAKALLSTGDTGFIPNLVLLKPDGAMVSNDNDTVMKRLKEMAGA